MVLGRSGSSGRRAAAWAQPWHGRGGLGTAGLSWRRCLRAGVGTRRARRPVGSDEAGGVAVATRWRGRAARQQRGSSWRSELGRGSAAGGSAAALLCVRVPGVKEEREKREKKREVRELTLNFLKIFN